MVTSTLKGEGVSTVALNLAYSLEMDKKRVILVDADWKTPSLAKMTGTKTQGGLAEAIQTGKLEDCLSLVKGKNIGLLASAKPQKNPYSLLNSKELPMIMQRLRNGADYIIIDAGSCEESENVRLADLCDRILYVIKQDEATGAQILNALENSVLRTGGICRSDFEWSQHGIRKLRRRLWLWKNMAIASMEKAMDRLERINSRGCEDSLLLFTEGKDYAGKNPCSG